MGAATDVGRLRQVNEDSLLAVPHVYVVADGMGGHAAGDLASAIVVEELRALAGTVVDIDSVTRTLDSANARVRGLAADGAPSAATTVSGVIGVVEDGVPYWLVANLGDSRVYQLSRGSLAQVSVDHSVVQELIDNGELEASAARTHPQRHVVTRAVGAPDSLEPDYWLLPAVVGDRIVVCSDGLTVEVDDGQLCERLLAEPEPQVAADTLLALALASGGRDNITVLVIDVRALLHEFHAEQTIPKGQPGSGMRVDDTLPRIEVPVR